MKTKPKKFTLKSVFLVLFSFRLNFLPDNLQKVCSCTKIYFKISFFGFVFILIKLSYLPQQHTTSLTHLRHPQKKTQTQNPAMSSINPNVWLCCSVAYFVFFAIIVRIALFLRFACLRNFAAIIVCWTPRRICVRIARFPAYEFNDVAFFVFCTLAHRFGFLSFSSWISKDHDAHEENWHDDDVLEVHDVEGIIN